METTVNIATKDGNWTTPKDCPRETKRRGRLARAEAARFLFVPADEDDEEEGD